MPGSGDQMAAGMYPIDADSVNGKFISSAHQNESPVKVGSFAQEQIQDIFGFDELGDRLQITH